jgi:hypothetical protein
MEDTTTADDKKKEATKTPKGAGYTTRIDGKKKLTTSLLEQQVEQVQAKMRYVLLLLMANLEA